MVLEDQKVDREASSQGNGLAGVGVAGGQQLGQWLKTSPRSSHSHSQSTSYHAQSRGARAFSPDAQGCTSLILHWNGQGLGGGFAPVPQSGVDRPVVLLKVQQTDKLLWY